MKEAEAEMKRLKETNVNLMEAQEAKPEIPPQSMSHSEEEIVALEEKFGMPYSQIKANWDMQSLIMQNSMAPIKNAILSQQYESTLNQLEKDNDLFKKYRGKVEAKLAGTPIEEKATKKVIKNAWSSVIAENIEDIRQIAIEEGRKMVTASPEAIPVVAGAEKTVDASVKKIPLSEDVKAYLVRVGANPDDVEKFHNEKGTEEKGEKTGWAKMFV